MKSLNLVTGDVVWSGLHRKLVRFVRWADDSFAVVGDRDSMNELPDHIHRDQVSLCVPLVGEPVSCPWAELVG